VTDLTNILLIDDNPDDVELALAAFGKTKLAKKVMVVSDGIEAMQYLRQQGAYCSVEEPTLVLLDLNMPCKDGREVLAEMKGDTRLCKIP
jgi:two-component system response regulator